MYITLRTLDEELLTASMERKTSLVKSGLFSTLVALLHSLPPDGENLN